MRYYLYQKVGGKEYLRMSIEKVYWLKHQFVVDFVNWKRGEARTLAGLEAIYTYCFFINLLGKKSKVFRVEVKE